MSVGLKGTQIGVVIQSANGQFLTATLRWRWSKGDPKKLFRGSVVDHSRAPHIHSMNLVKELQKDPAFRRSVIGRRAVTLFPVIIAPPRALE